MRFCPICLEEIDEDQIRCLNCGKELARKIQVCCECGNQNKNTTLIREKEYCNGCANNLINSVIVTTTNSIENHVIRKYIGIESSEVVIGTGLWSELSSMFQDFFGQRSTEFERKLSKAKQMTIKKIKYIAAQKGANAVVGMDLNYTEFSSNRIGIIAAGTLVEIE